MILPFVELKHHNFCLSGINVIYQRPIYRNLLVRGRIPNGFLFIRHGECQYTYDGGEITLSPGSVVYLPAGSHHKLTVSSERLEFYRVDFTLQVNGEIALFSNKPLKISSTTTPECLDTLRSLNENYSFKHNSITKTEKMCTIFSSLQEPSPSTHTTKLSPAINYLHTHMTEHVDCHKLAKLCFLSTAQFYNLFHAEHGTTPLGYRNELLLQQAVLLLESGEISVTEVSSMLGFESVAYFSRFFKKHKGISPSRYQKECTQTLGCSHHSTSPA